jgi:hypothetical protein
MHAPREIAQGRHDPKLLPSKRLLNPGSWIQVPEKTRPAGETPAGLAKLFSRDQTENFSPLPPSAPVQIRLGSVELENFLRDLDRLFLLA